VSVVPISSRQAPSSAAALRHARRLLARHPVIDGHNDLPWTIRNDTQARGDVAKYDLRQPTRGDTDSATQGRRRRRPVLVGLHPRRFRAAGSRASSSNRSTSRGA
jgi:hypothetical protein